MSGCFGSDIKVKEAVTANNRDDRTLKNREQVVILNCQEPSRHNTHILQGQNDILKKYILNYEINE